MVSVVNANPLKVDPTRTKILRDEFAKAILRRIRRFKRELMRLVIVEDAFGLKQSTRMTAFNTRFAFESTPAKRDQFVKWIEEQLGPIIGASDASNTEDAYFAAYIQDGYDKGAGRAYAETRKLEKYSGRLEAEYAGGKKEFLRLHLSSPAQIESVKVLASRTFDDLVNLTSDMKNRLSRELLDGFVRGQGPRVIASNLAKAVRIAENRAIVIARTEIIRAHAEGSLDALEGLGVDKIGVMVEWSTAGDSRVCELCASLEGVILSTSQAHGMFPRHPQCRCTPIPANIGEDKSGQVRGKAAVEKRLADSIRKEGGRQKSRWQGADLKVKGRVPKDAVEKLVGAPPKKPLPTPVKPEPKVPSKPPAPPIPTPSISKGLTPAENRDLIRLQNLKKSNRMGPYSEKQLDELASKAEAAGTYVDRTAPIEQRIAEFSKRKGEELRKEILALEKEMAKERKRIAPELNKLKEEVKEVFSEEIAVMRRLELKSAERQALLDELKVKKDAIVARKQAVETEFAKVSGSTKKGRERVHDVLKVDEGTRPKNKLVRREYDAKKGTADGQVHSARYQAKLEEAEDFVEKITSQNAIERIELEAVQMKNYERAYYHEGRVYLTESNETGVFVHEIMHDVEEVGTGVHRAMEEFRRMRIARAGTPDVKLAEVFPKAGFGKNEIGNADDWIKAFGKEGAYYVGKPYSNNSEILTMGIQKLFEDPIRFAKNDPEFFDLVVGILRGEL